MTQDTLIRKIVVLVGVAGVIALLAYTYSAFTQANYMNHGPIFISVTGEGEVFATPDIATFSFTVSAKEDTASDAQTASAKSVNAILDFLKEKGVEERDVKTQNYSLNPRYEYPDTRCTDWGCPPVGEPKIIGYEVAQSVEIKVRKTDDAGMLITGVGELGATNVSGISFTIDDEDTLKKEAREKAIAVARKDADILASSLGVRIVRITNFWEETLGDPYAYGMGGGYDMKTLSVEEAMVSPSIPMGENTITSRVNISYEVR